MIYAADFMKLDTAHREILWLAGSLSMLAHQRDEQAFFAYLSMLIKVMKRHFAEEQALLERCLGRDAVSEHISEHTALLLLFSDSAGAIVQPSASWERRYSVVKVLEDCVMREITESDPYLLRLAHKKVLPL